MSLNFDKRSIEKRHNKRYMGIFLMFAVVAAVVGLFMAFSVSSMTGYGFLDILGPKTTTAQSPAQGTTLLANCTDGDGGLNYFLRSDCRDDRGWMGNDVCSYNYIGEWHCYSANPRCSLEYFNCNYVPGSNGVCSNGACQKMTNVTCYDSDGLDYFNKGYCRDLTSVNWDSCINSTTGGSVCEEYYCNTQIAIPACAKKQIDCSIFNNATTNQTYVCFDGACKIKCVDSDGGLNFGERGICKDVWGTYVDNCNATVNQTNVTIVDEYYCNEYNVCGVQSQDCLVVVGNYTKCSDGACVREKDKIPTGFNAIIERYLATKK